MSEIEEKRKQVADQCRCVVGLCEALATVHRETEAMYRQGHADSILDIVGQRTARIMEDLGDTLNGMDAVDETDAQWDEVFERAHAMFPVKSGEPDTPPAAPEAKTDG